MDVTSYLLGKQQGGGSTINNQNKSITINQNGTTSVSADAGYTGLGTVGITTNVTPDLESKSVTINSNTTTVITPSIDKDGLSQVSVTTNVEAQPDLETKSVTITENGTTIITPTTGKDGMSEVEVTTNVSGGGASEYFNTSLSTYSGSNSLVKKLPIIDFQNRSNRVLFANWDNLEEIAGILNTGNLTSMNDMFGYCSHLINIPLFDTKNVTDMTTTFQSCTKLETIPSFNMSKVSSFDRTFASCTSLKNVPVIDFSSVNGSNSFRNTFYSCTALTDVSLDNILQSCISAINYSGTKTLKQLGISNYNYYPTSRIEALPHYQDFLDAGWTIGY